MLALGALLTIATAVHAQPPSLPLMGPNWSIVLELRRPLQDDRLIVTMNGQTVFQKAGHLFAVDADRSIKLDSDSTLGIVVKEWSGSAYCCATFHVFAVTRAGIAHAGSISAGQTDYLLYRQQNGRFHLISNDPQLDSLGRIPSDTLRSPVFYAYDNRRLKVDPEAMRRAVGSAIFRCGLTDTDALLGSNLPDWAGGVGGDTGESGQRASQPSDISSLIREWRKENGGSLNILDVAQMAVCLIYGGQAPAAHQLIAALGRPDSGAVTRDIGAAIGKSEHRAVLRRLNGPALDDLFLKRRMP